MSGQPAPKIMFIDVVGKLQAAQIAKLGSRPEIIDDENVRFAARIQRPDQVAANKTCTARDKNHKALACALLFAAILAIGVALRFWHLTELPAVLDPDVWLHAPFILAFGTAPWVLRLQPALIGNPLGDKSGQHVYTVNLANGQLRRITTGLASDAVLGGLSPAEQAEFHRLLGRLGQHLERFLEQGPAANIG